ncbi:unnamed protein product [Cochlearia groenlandica]
MDFTGGYFTGNYFTGSYLTPATTMMNLTGGSPYQLTTTLNLTGDQRISMKTMNGEFPSSNTQTQRLYQES